MGKPQCTRIDDFGHITSRGHARKGETIARQALWTGSELAAPLSFARREHIAKLVRFHGLPLQFLNNAEPERAVIKASQSVRLDHVALLAEADVKGRICSDQSELLERVELFREFCQENQCYGSPRQFPTHHSRFVYLQGGRIDPNLQAYDDTAFEVVLMSGLPGVGKDTWIREHLNEWPVISLDAVRKELKISPEEDQGRVIQTAKERARVLMRKQQSFVWNATNVTRMMRRQLIDFFVSYRGRVRIVYIDAPFNDILKRNQDRQKGVPEHVIYKLLSKLEVPDVTEAHVVEWSCH